MANKRSRSSLNIYTSFLLILQFFVIFQLPTKSEEEKFLRNNNSEVISGLNNDISSEDYFERDFYLIGPGDTLKLNLFDAKEFSGELKVMSDGSAQFPLIGSQYLNNLTIEQASKLVENKYKEELLRPELHLSVLKARPIRVSVVGEIVKPGVYSLIGSKNNSLIEGSRNINEGLPTIIDALQKAGGITPKANLKKVSLLRRLPGEDKRYKKAEINLLDIVLEGDQEQNVFLFDGDIIKVDMASEINKDIKKISQTNLSPMIMVNVVGQVNVPGQTRVRANTPLVQAIYMAGGPVDWKANTGRVELVRVNDNGTATRRKFKIKLDENVSSELNPPLMNEDIIYVRSNNINRITQGIGTFTEPFADIITTYSLFRILNGDV
ncbi:sugar transporter [Prochlorococcus marinus XMU1412]|uniref:SLBB domain-containing protein n=1 Tax=Prochlorococcus marinus TaxID=1219 RepID=UPI001ADCB39A|nr:SLBB domain-containing protein [Prochlorococcus marinus]MBO8240562.1 sugar transporter [Prochlorococcus marinus XMU1412]